MEKDIKKQYKEAKIITFEVWNLELELMLRLTKKAREGGNPLNDFTWYVPLRTPNIYQQNLVSEQLLSTSATELAKRMFSSF